MEPAANAAPAVAERRINCLRVRVLPCRMVLPFLPVMRSHFGRLGWNWTYVFHLLRGLQRRPHLAAQKCHQPSAGFLPIPRWHREGNAQIANVNWEQRENVTAALANLPLCRNIGIS